MIYKPPQNIADRNRDKLSVFLGGTIEMGNSVDWQKEFCQLTDSKNINIFNPRRDDWDSTWEQDITNPQFHQQVDWELTAMHQASWIVMNLLPGTQSPISLLEIGLHANTEKLLVCCPDGFWKKGNVDIICHKYDIRQFKHILQVVAFIKEQLPAELKEVKGLGRSGSDIML